MTTVTIQIPNNQTIAIKRGRDIVAGKDKLIPHDEVMKEMEQLIEDYAD